MLRLGNKRDYCGVDVIYIFILSCTYFTFDFLCISIPAVKMVEREVLRIGIGVHMATCMYILGLKSTYIWLCNNFGYVSELTHRSCRNPISLSRSPYYVEILAYIISVINSLLVHPYAVQSPASDLLLVGVYITFVYLPT